MCRTSNLIHHRKSTLDLTNDKIAEKMRGDGVKITGDAIQKYFAESSGVPIENLGSFLRALGLKVVPTEMPEVSQQEFQALKMFAGKYLTSTESGE